MPCYFRHCVIDLSLSHASHVWQQWGRESAWTHWNKTRVTWINRHHLQPNSLLGKEKVFLHHSDLFRLHMVGWSLVILGLGSFYWAFPGGSVVKTSACNAGDTRDAGSIPGSGRSPGRGNGKPTPVFLPGKSHGHPIELHGVARSQTLLSTPAFCISNSWYSVCCKHISLSLTVTENLEVKYRILCSSILERYFPVIQTIIKYPLWI